MQPTEQRPKEPRQDTSTAELPPPASPPPGDSAAPAPAAAITAEPKVRLRTGSGESRATLIGAAAASAGLVWIVYERVLPFSGVLGFWICWYLVFLLLYWVMARMQWDRLEAT